MILTGIPTLQSGVPGVVVRPGKGLIIRGTVNAQRCGCFVVADRRQQIIPTTPDRTPDPAPPAEFEPRYLHPKPAVPTREYAGHDQPPGTVEIPGATYLSEIEGTYSVREAAADRGRVAVRVTGRTDAPPAWGFDYEEGRCNGIDGTAGRNKGIVGMAGATTEVTAFPSGESSFGVLDRCSTIGFRCVADRTVVAH